MRVYINTERSAICGLPDYGIAGKAYRVFGYNLRRAFSETFHYAIARSIPDGWLIATHTTECGTQSGPGWYDIAPDTTHDKNTAALCDTCPVTLSELAS